MLVLSRKAGQKIQIGPEVEVVVLSTRKGSVKLGFIAPRDVAIGRHEIDGLHPRVIDSAETVLKRGIKCASSVNHRRSAK